jgi:hypothetical protein
MKMSRRDEDAQAAGCCLDTKAYLLTGFQCRRGITLSVLRNATDQPLRWGV